MMNVALIGLGSVGKGVAGILGKKDLGIKITGIADSKSGCMNPDGLDIKTILGTKNETGSCGDQKISALDVIRKAEYDVLIEVTPTNAITGEPAIGYIKAVSKQDMEAALAILRRVSNQKSLLLIEPLEEIA